MVNKRKQGFIYLNSKIQKQNVQKNLNIEIYKKKLCQKRNKIKFCKQIIKNNKVN